MLRKIIIFNRFHHNRQRDEQDGRFYFILMKMLQEIQSLPENEQLQSLVQVYLWYEDNGVFITDRRPVSIHHTLFLILRNCFIHSLQRVFFNATMARLIIFCFRDLVVTKSQLNHHWKVRACRKRNNLLLS